MSSTSSNKRTPLHDGDRVDQKASRRLAQRIQATIGQCYLNAVTAVEDIADFATARYCEGAVLIPPFPIPVAHGWIETTDGAILDPTLALPDPVTRQDRWPAYYFVGRRYTRAALRRLHAHDAAGSLYLPIDEDAIARACAAAWHVVSEIRADIQAEQAEQGEPR